MIDETLTLNSFRVQSEICQSENPWHLSLALTVLCVDTSPGNFIEDHVLRASWEAALHAGNTQTVSAPELNIDDAGCKNSAFNKAYGGRNWHRVASGSLHVWTQGLAQAW